MVSHELENPVGQESEAIYNYKLWLVNELVSTGGIDATDRRPGYRLDVEKIDEVIQRYLTVLNTVVDDGGEKLDFSVPEDELEMISYSSENSYRWLVKRLTKIGAIDKRIAFYAGLLNRPSSIRVYGEKAAEATGFVSWPSAALFNYIDREIIGGDGQKKQLHINSGIGEIGIVVNAAESLYLNMLSHDLVVEALASEGVELDCSEENMLVLIQVLAHEYAHALIEAKVYANLLNKIRTEIDLDSLQFPKQREEAIRCVLSGLPGDTFFDVVYRAYQAEMSKYLNWIFRSTTQPEVLENQIDNQSIRTSSVERVTKGMELIAFRECLAAFLRMRKEDDSVAEAVTENLFKLTYEKDHKDLASVNTMLEDHGLAVEVIDHALKEIDRRYKGEIFGGYTMSKLFGYFFPLSEEELIRVLTPLT